MEKPIPSRFAPKPIVQPRPSIARPSFPAKSNPNAPRPTPAPKPLPKLPTPPQSAADDTLFRGRDHVSVRDLTRELTKNPKYRSQLARKLSKKPRDPLVERFMKESVEEIKKSDITGDGFVDRREIISKKGGKLRLGKEEYYNTIRYRVKEREGGITPQEQWERRFRKTGKDFKEELGL